MDAKEIIGKLKDLGLSEYEIAKRLETVSQSTVNRIATGKSPGTTYRVWKKLYDLLAQLTINPGRTSPVTRARA